MMKLNFIRIPETFCWSKKMYNFAEERAKLYFPFLTSDPAQETALADIYQDFTTDSLHVSLWAGKEKLGIEGAVNRLTEERAAWKPAADTVPGAPVKVTWSFATASQYQQALGVLPIAESAINETTLLLVEKAMDLIESVANIRFERVGTGTAGDAAYSGDGQILVTNALAGSLKQLSGTDAEGNAGIEKAGISIGFATEIADINTGLHFVMKELLGSLGVVGVEATAVMFQGSRVRMPDSYFENSLQYSVLGAVHETLTGANYGHGSDTTRMYHDLGAPLLVDIMALQKLYGANTSTFAGDTVYGFGSNTGDDRLSLTQADGKMVASIWDGGGIDTIDLSGLDADSLINLREGAFSSFGGLKNNFSIAPGAVIENAVGGSGDDTIAGNDADNGIAGGDGDDIIYGRDGSDVINGNEGNDVIWRNDGDDFILGGDGRDQLHGDAGNDVIHSESGGGIVYGGEGDDTLSASSGTTHIFGEEGDDQIFGGTEADGLYGGIGDDNISGGGGNDWLYGQEGDDFIWGDSGNDTIDGGEGFDQIAGGDGNDTILAGAGGGFVYGNAGDDTITADTGFNQIWGDDGNDTITGGADRDVIVGGNDDDTVFGRGGEDDIFGGSGDDTIEGGAGYDQISGGTGRDIIRGGDDADLIYGEDGNDDLYGDNGDDILFGDEGRDWLRGGLGNDELHGGYGNDVLQGQAGNDRFIGGAGHDIVHAGTGDDTAELGIGNDSFVGEAGNDTAYGGAGNDTLNAGAGNDFLYGESGNDRLEGWGGDDTLLGGKGADIVYGGAGNDVLSTDGMYQVRTADRGGDQLFGGDGDDILFGRSYNQTLEGGAGMDVFYIANRATTTVITDFELGIDNIAFESIGGEISRPIVANFTISDRDGSAVVTFGDVGGEIILAGLSVDQVNYDLLV
jgi:Ca2+-binding RTX toxin-like protein